MLSLSPAKLLVILVVALIVLGPDKLPQMARQLGALWHDLRRWRERVEREVRGTFPNLPPTHEVAQAVRSPLSFLDRLADEHERSAGEGSSTDPGEGRTAGSEGSPGATGGPGVAASNGAATNGAATNGNGHAPPGDHAPLPTAPGHAPWASGTMAPDDPSMN